VVSPSIDVRTSSPSIDVRTSGIWQTTSTVIAASDACIVVDPAYFPRELDELATLARSRGEVRAVVFTHGHWDHVIGWQSFPGAEVWTSPSLAQAIASGAEIASRNLADARAFDARWYIERPAPVRWPDAARPLGEGERIDIAGVRIEAALLPGHSDDGLALLVEDRWLLPGDYLSPCEIPFIDDLNAYRATLRRFDALLAEIEAVIPGHGPRLSRVEARAIAAADLVYLDGIALAVDRGDAAAGLAVALPRAASVPGMWEHHLANCRKAGLSVPAMQKSPTST
jgi:hydroxyacylglutathione hydrolase